jgi:hypothetical protein
MTDLALEGMRRPEYLLEQRGVAGFLREAHEVLGQELKQLVGLQ